MNTDEHGSKPPVVKTCERCGEQFAAAQASQRFCAARCRKAAWRKANPENRENLNERARRWREAHPEKERESCRRWREANREKVRECSRKWREANREKVLERSRRWREANREKVLECHRRWHETENLVRAADLLASIKEAT